MALDIVHHDDGAITITANGRTQRYSKDQASELTMRLCLPLLTEQLARITGVEY